MGQQISYTPVDDLVTALRDTGIRSVDTDPAKVNLPGVWVKVEGFKLDLLAGYTISTTVYLVAQDPDYTRGGQQLIDLFDQVTDVIDPSDNATIATVALTMPAGTVQPALAFPFDLYAT